ncbi:TPA: tRNA glutamyl-Q(34) synthetase GluQRS [Neisseria meningitidis]|uniref:Glutamyl-Q tRNA(Asp) synthetase n=1 Tax=Neisseria meningitidis serogroup C (strain 053442) TaxID=374833 RepID=GLUQ_NEIM0|nr:tRNA glutamyl-Q(34) synthetase GluQRS [Neisseria meningitidis]A9M2P1.1 RecName: Full=Glutamyl-Q tRNA(Asp) synthetase; Short=Glu-Q-RSs [Neisseria meningitidis 053442]ABX73933.1 glutamyl-tRNA synthetase [Neisseria meningitidis 053442]MCL4976335.1 tRNA glutamyl-Q(34) synthetase GluQRS [Neisseria meningitidis]MCL5842372.1 tRNA glutamyl-Q(34) synthetase GluQRS [Neisseria meningitidis]MCL5844383.1 tRNA glutamyl-Q(34) synthetase GluQRS [Neisseria meningitidis]MCL5846320.1 tRNA glutamyl-Q(34) synt
MYTGRFAPSPTGLLHIGSLLTAAASYADARSNGGKWLVRMEDLDPPREMPGAASHILHTLEAFGFEWDGEVAYQSRRYALYEETLCRLKTAGLVYPCHCSRKDWQAAARRGADGFVYNGRCRHPGQRPAPQGKQPAWRIRVPDRDIGFSDGIVGGYAQNLARDIGDFVLLRADGYWAYQLAVVADDAEQGVTHIVRGQDLLVSTPRQIYLQQCLGVPTPQYAHLPLLTNAQGQKWSKQTLAPALDLNRREQLLRQVFRYLNLPEAPETDRPAELLDWAVAHWDMDKVPKHAVTPP